MQFSNGSVIDYEWFCNAPTFVEIHIWRYIQLHAYEYVYYGIQKLRFHTA